MTPKRKRFYVVNIVWGDDKQESIGRVVWLRMRYPMLILVNDQGRRLYLNIANAKRILVVRKGEEEEEEEDFAL